MFHTLEHWDFGVENNGNTMSIENMQGLCNRVKSTVGDMNFVSYVFSKLLFSSMWFIFMEIFMEFIMFMEIQKVGLWNIHFIINKLLHQLCSIKSEISLSFKRSFSSHLLAFHIKYKMFDF